MNYIYFIVLCKVQKSAHMKSVCRLNRIALCIINRKVKQSRNVRHQGVRHECILHCRLGAFTVSPVFPRVGYGRRLKNRINRYQSALRRPHMQLVVSSGYIKLNCAGKVLLRSLIFGFFRVVFGFREYFGFILIFFV